MEKTKIHGASDDLIEIDGHIQNEEGCYYNSNKSISCSDGTTATISYDGSWRIMVIKKGHLFEKLIFGNEAEAPHTDPDATDCSPYSDVLVLKEGIEWVMVGRKIFKP